MNLLQVLALPQHTSKPFPRADDVIHQAKLQYELTWHPLLFPSINS